MTLKILDLFSGIGGFSYAAEVLVGGFETVAFCEYDKKAQEVLKLRWPDVPIYPDIKELDEPIQADIITGGYPCQPFSNAGKRGGEADDRHLWPEMFRIIQLVRPKYVICENVAGHISMGLDSVLSDLETEGYRTEVFVLPACAVDAKHRRDRVWIVCYSESSGDWGEVRDFCEEERGSRGSLLREPVSTSESPCQYCGYEFDHDLLGRYGCPNCEGEGLEDVADTPVERVEGIGASGQQKSQTHEGQGLSLCGSESDQRVWLSEPSVGRVANGIPGRVDRLKQLGNSIVPQLAAQLFRCIREIEDGNGKV